MFVHVSPHPGIAHFIAGLICGLMFAAIVCIGRKPTNEP